MHEYWDKQPVPRKDTTPGEIEKTRDVSKKTTKLPDGFVWSSCSLKEACEFLNSHYVSDGVFRLCHDVDLDLLQFLYLKSNAVQTRMMYGRLYTLSTRNYQLQLRSPICGIAI